MSEDEPKHCKNMRYATIMPIKSSSLCEQHSKLRIWGTKLHVTLRKSTLPGKFLQSNKIFVSSQFRLHRLIHKWLIDAALRELPRRDRSKINFFSFCGAQKPSAVIQKWPQFFYFVTHRCGISNWLSSLHSNGHLWTFSTQNEKVFTCCNGGHKAQNDEGTDISHFEPIETFFFLSKCMNPVRRKAQMNIITWSESWIVWVFFFLFHGLFKRAITSDEIFRTERSLDKTKLIQYTVFFQQANQFSPRTLNFRTKKEEQKKKRKLIKKTEKECQTSDIRKQQIEWNEKITSA